MSSAELAAWSTSYLVYPAATGIYPSTDTFPHHVDEVTDATTVVYGELGSSWDRVNDESVYDDIIKATEDLTNAIESIPVALDMVKRSSDGKTVNAAVVAEIIARYVTGQEGEFVKLTADQIAANSIGASHIQAGAIDGTIITGATIRTGASNPRVQMDQTGLFATDSSGAETFRMDSSTGSVRIRGDVGLSDSWSTTRFTDLLASTGTDYATDGFRWGSGLYFQVTNRSMTAQGSVAMVHSPNDTNNYNFPNQHGLRLQAPLASTGNNSAPPFAALWESGWEVRTYNNVNASHTIGQWGTSTLSDNWGLNLRNRYTTAGDYSDQGFWAWAVNNGSYSGYYFYQGLNAERFLVDSDQFYLYAGKNNFNYRTAYNSTASLAINARDFSWFGYNSATSFYVYHGAPSTHDTNRVMKLNLTGITESGFYGHDTQSGIYFNGKYAFVNSSGFSTSGGSKNFAMQVPTLSADRGGLDLYHSTTESPGAGIEYWATETVPDSGLVVWALPDYVPYIAASYGARSVFVTPSSGTATAVLHDDLAKDSGWYVEVRAEPGATVNILVKLNRILEDGAGGWEDNGFQVWRLAERNEPTAIATVSGGMGPLPEEASREHDSQAERQLLEPYVDVPALQEELYAAGMTDAPIMASYEPPEGSLPAAAS